jgi:hypothetical protein
MVDDYRKRNKQQGDLSLIPADTIIDGTPQGNRSGPTGGALHASRPNSPWIRGAPQSGWIRGRHLAHERPNGRLRGRQTATTACRAPRPSPAKPLAMPSHDGLGLHEHERRAPVPPRLGQQDPRQPISAPGLRTDHGASQRVELLPEREVLEDEFVMSTTGQRQRADDDKDRVKHSRIVSCYAQAINRRSSGADFGDRRCLGIRLGVLVQPRAPRHLRSTLTTTRSKRLTSYSFSAEGFPQSSPKFPMRFPTALETLPKSHWRAEE